MLLIITTAWVHAARRLVFFRYTLRSLEVFFTKENSDFIIQMHTTLLIGIVFGAVEHTQHAYAYVLHRNTSSTRPIQACSFNSIFTRPCLQAGRVTLVLGLP